MSATDPTTGWLDDIASSGSSARLQPLQARRNHPFRCPNGHACVQLGKDSFDCKTCYRQGRDRHRWPKDELVDLRGGEHGDL